jgi:diadenosine tetraphosphatase ApaH/serine/threonine PP2A family protein phosphatase
MFKSQVPSIILPSHEGRDFTKQHTDRTFKLFSESFSALPLATLVGKKYLVLHGGLFSDDKITLDDIRKLNRHNQRQPGQAGLMMEMLWTDPQTEPGRGPSKRGVGMQFGPDVTKRFCENNGLDAIIRSHEVRMEGYEEEHDGKCITGTVASEILHRIWLTIFQFFLPLSTVTARKTKVLTLTSVLIIN